MAIPYKDIAKHYGVSHTTIRRWRKKLECKHDWVVNVIAGYRKGNSKKPHPKVLKKTIEKSMNPPIKD
jgi:uncharacterized protein YjcR